MNRAHAIDRVDPRPAIDPVYIKANKRVVDLRSRARRFIFDTEASEHMGRFIRLCGDLIIANRQFAIPPYETTYIEFQMPAMIKGLGRRTNASEDAFKNIPKDVVVGYLIHGNRIWGCSSDIAGDAALSMFSYELGRCQLTSIFKQPFNDKDPYDSWWRASFLLASTMHDVTDEVVLSEVISEVAIHVEAADIAPKHREFALRSAAGEMRNIWALLLLLNQPKHVHLQQVPHRVGILSGKRHVYAAHNIVTIHLGNNVTDIRKVLGHHLQAPRRRHEVRGHFAHWHTREGCTHDWGVMPSIDKQGQPHWTCQHCKGLRVWRKAHLRGDATVGFVVKPEYAVER